MTIGLNIKMTKAEKSVEVDRVERDDALDRIGSVKQANKESVDKGC